MEVKWKKKEEAPLSVSIFSVPSRGHHRVLFSRNLPLTSAFQYLPLSRPTHSPLFYTQIIPVLFDSHTEENTSRNECNKVKLIQANKKEKKHKKKEKETSVGTNRGILTK